MQDEDSPDPQYLEFLQLMAGSPCRSTGLNAPAACSLGRDLDLEREQSSRTPLRNPALPEFLNYPEPSFLASTPGRLGRQQANREPEPSSLHADSGSYAQSSATKVPTQAGRQQARQAQRFPQHAQKQDALLMPADCSSFQRSRSGSVPYPQQCQSSDTLAPEGQLGLHHDEGPCPRLQIGKVMQSPREPDAVPGQGRHVDLPAMQHMPCPAFNTSSEYIVHKGEPQDILLHREVA